MPLETTLRDPIHLTDPLMAEPPKPTPGCDVCSSRMAQWHQATEQGSPAYDPSHAVDLAVEIGRHPHGWKLNRDGKRVPK
jgi:hypothetical protein